MKQIIFNVILILTFFFAAFAQTEDKVSQCPVINVLGPAQLIRPDEPITFASRISEGFENPKI